jgi:hypothetical protein
VEFLDAGTLNCIAATIESFKVPDNDCYELYLFMSSGIL